MAAWHDCVKTKRSIGGATARATLSRAVLQPAHYALPYKSVFRVSTTGALPVHDVIHWPDLSRCISSSGLSEVPSSLLLYRIYHTSSLTTWRCSETALPPLTLG